MEVLGVDAGLTFELLILSKFTVTRDFQPNHPWRGSGKSEASMVLLGDPHRELLCVCVCVCVCVWKKVASYRVPCEFRDVINVYSPCYKLQYIHISLLELYSWGINMNTNSDSMTPIVILIPWVIKLRVVFFPPCMPLDGKTIMFKAFIGFIDDGD